MTKKLKKLDCPNCDGKLHAGKFSAQQIEECKGSAYIAVIEYTCASCGFITIQVPPDDWCKK